jgi:hypothetical protein
MTQRTNHRDLAATRAELLAVARDLDRETWTQPVYAHGDERDWSAMDLLRHLAWAESGMLRLVQQIQAGEEASPPISTSIATTPVA